MYKLNVALVPCGWVYATINGKAVTKNMVHNNIITNRKDVQINCNNVILFYNNDTANFILQNYLISI